MPSATAVTGDAVKKEIAGYFHCRHCIDEMPQNIAPHEWVNYEIGYTQSGVQVWCKRHDINVVHLKWMGAVFDFKGEPLSVLPILLEDNLIQKAINALAKDERMNFRQTVQTMTMVQQFRNLYEAERKEDKALIAQLQQRLAIHDTEQAWGDIKNMIWEDKE